MFDPAPGHGCGAGRSGSGRIGASVEGPDEGRRANLLTRRLLQLAVSGLADDCQGTGVLNRSLVDHDNRRPVGRPAPTARPAAQVAPPVREGA